MPYRCEIDAIQVAFGGESAETRNQILDLSAGSLQALDMNLDPAVESRAILQGYLNGRVEYTDRGYHYWYVIEILAGGFGEIMSNRYWCPANIDVLWSIDELRLYDLGIKILPSPDDLPVVFITRRQHFKTLSQKISEKLKYENMKNQFLNWISEAEENQQDLFLFYY